MLFIFFSKDDICTTWLDSASPITKSFVVETAETASVTRQTTWRRGFTDQHRRLVVILVRDNTSVKIFGNASHRQNSHQRFACRSKFQLARIKAVRIFLARTIAFCSSKQLRSKKNREDNLSVKLLRKVFDNFVNQCLET